MTTLTTQSPNLSGLLPSIRLAISVPTHSRPIVTAPLHLCRSRTLRPHLHKPNSNPLLSRGPGRRVVLVDGGLGASQITPSHTFMD